MAEFKKLRGNRVFLEIPKKDDSKIIVDENTREAMNRALVQTFRKLKIYEVGDLITDLNKGDFVLVDPEMLKRAPIIPLSETRDVLMISQFDVALIW
jgi:hypothetical protein